MKLGLSGRLTARHHRLAAHAAVPDRGHRGRASSRWLTIPREEEPQISVPMVDIMVRADGLSAPDAVELVAKPLEAIVKSVDGVEHVYTQADDDQVMVTARFKVGTDPDDADRAHPREDPRQLRPDPGRHSRAADRRRAASTTCRSWSLTLSPKPDAAGRWTDQALYEVAAQAAHRGRQGRRRRPDLHRRRPPDEIRVEPDPERLIAPRRLARRPDRGRSPARPQPSRRARSARRARPRHVIAGHTLQTAGDVGLLTVPSTGPPGLCARRRQRRAGAARGPGAGLALRPRRPGLERDAGRQPRRSPSARAPTRSCVAGAILKRVDSAEGPAAPGRPAGLGHPRLRRDRQRQGQRAAVPSRPGHPVDRRADRLRHRLARGAGHGHRHPDHHPADALRRQPDGLHHQPRQPVRADLLDRHPGRRRHRDDREHLATLGDERRPRAPAGGDRGGRRGRQSDGRGDTDRRRRASADAVRFRADGPLHGAHPGQRLGGDGLLVLRRRGHRAMADDPVRAQNAAGRWPRGSRGPPRPALPPRGRPGDRHPARAPGPSSLASASRPWSPARSSPPRP